MIKGIIAGNFDVIHPGYVRFFCDAKENACEWLVVALQGDPTIERPDKAKPILNVEERTEILMALQSVDEVVHYNTEAELIEVLKSIQPHVRILGSDYQGKSFTGDDLSIPVYYHERNHEWSTTKFKNDITEQVIKQR
ncbi:MAG TPA: glycerol-3-phosphate cytidylyltransferase [Dehalococcoidia bacterium]|jgi:glycerol-3-phosphate cytidylyltransferase|nr:glycerol-3-phosphate cytidylyltransferase [Dehalococcoidia bacterium]